MYVVIDKSTSAVVYKGTLFMNEGEYLDIDTGELFSDNSGWRMGETDIRVSDSIYIRPIITNIDASDILLFDIYGVAGESDIEMLMDICNTKFEFPPDLSGLERRDIRCINKKFMVYCLLMIIREICKLNDLEWLKRILDFEINVDFPFQEIEQITDVGWMPIDNALTEFVWDYEYTDRTDLFNYTFCVYYSIRLNRKELINFLEENYSSGRHAQIFFDIALFYSRESLFKKYFFKVELNAENIRKVTIMAYASSNVDAIKFLLNNSDKFVGELDEHALIMAIKLKEYELVQEIINKHPNTASVYCLNESVRIEDIRIIKLLIEAGMDLKSNEFKGVNISIERNDIDMLRLFLENGASVELAAQHAIKRLCSIKNCEIAKRLLELSRVDKNSIEVETSKSEERVGTQLKFNKTMLCLIEVCQSYDPFRLDDNVECDEFLNHMNLYEKVIAIVNSKKKDITDVFPSYHTYVSFKDLKSITSRNYYVKLVEIIEYIVDNYLQNTLKHIEYNELGNSGCGDVEILNDRHYDIVKSDLANQNFEMLKLLIEYGMDINSYDSLILRTAYKAGDIGWINYFISKGAKFSKESDGLEEACKSDKVVVLEHWIRNGGVVPKNPEYPCINMACSLGNFDMVKLLVESGVDISDPERNGVRISCRLGLWRILDYLILAVTVK